MDLGDEISVSSLASMVNMGSGDNATSNLLGNNDSLITADSHLGLSQDRQGGLNLDKLLSMFGGNSSNLEYFLGLWNAMKMMTREEVKECVCDPRDEKKRKLIGSWRPVTRYCPDKLESGTESSLLMGGLAVKQTVLEDNVDDEKDKNRKNLSECHGTQDEAKSFHCGVYGCGEVLSSLASYESHYHRCHNFVCATCRRVFVSNFLLDIHLQENHDSYFAVLSPRIDMYRCLVESCDRKFRTAEQRKDHLVTEHKFPSSFSFHQPLKGSRNKDTKMPLHSSSCDTPTSEDGMDMALPCLPESSPSTADVAMETECPSTSTSSGSGTKKNSKGANKNDVQGKRVPSTICFGRGSQRAFQPGRGRGGKGGNWYQTKSPGDPPTTVDIESVDMKELGTALD